MPPAYTGWDPDHLCVIPSQTIDYWSYYDQVCANVTIGGMTPSNHHQLCVRLLIITTASTQERTGKGRGKKEKGKNMFRFPPKNIHFFCAYFILQPHSAVIINGFDSVLREHSCWNAGNHMVPLRTKPRLAEFKASTLLLYYLTNPTNLFLEEKK